MILHDSFIFLLSVVLRSFRALRFVRTLFPFSRRGLSFASSPRVNYRLFCAFSSVSLGTLWNGKRKEN